MVTSGGDADTSSPRVVNTAPPQEPGHQLSGSRIVRVSTIAVSTELIAGLKVETGMNGTPLV